MEGLLSAVLTHIVAMCLTKWVTHALPSNILKHSFSYTVRDRKLKPWQIGLCTNVSYRRGCFLGNIINNINLYTLQNMFEKRRRNKLEIQILYGFLANCSWFQIRLNNTMHKMSFPHGWSQKFNLYCQDCGKYF